MRREDYKKIDFVVSIQNDKYFLLQKSPRVICIQKGV